MNITVVGAGVSGLTTALLAAEAGHRVRVVAHRHPRDTTSAVAGASWGPHMVDDERVDAWAAASWRVFTDVAEVDGSAVRMVSGIEADPEVDATPRWAATVPGYRECLPGEAPPQYRTAWRYTIPLIDMPRYLDYLSRRLDAAGVSLEHRRVHELSGLSGDVVVNCAGLESRELVPDPTMRAIRGQMVETPNPGIEEFFLGNAIDGELTVIFPHPDHLVLGGIGVYDDENTEPDPMIEADILRRCTAVDPRIGGLPVIGRRVGLRPARATVRLERDPDDGRIVHNYGHGGSGVTLSWGCAADVLKLVEAF